MGPRLLVAPVDQLGSLWPPDGNVQPQYDLAWRRFQAGLVKFIAWQTEIVREPLGLTSS